MIIMQTSRRHISLLHQKKEIRRRSGDNLLNGGAHHVFMVKSLLDAPHILEIYILKFKHVEKDGLVVQGGMKDGDRGAFLAHLSPIVKVIIDGCLHKGYLL